MSVRNKTIASVARRLTPKKLRVKAYSKHRSNINKYLPEYKTKTFGFTGKPKAMKGSHHDAAINVRSDLLRTRTRKFLNKTPVMLNIQPTNGLILLGAAAYGSNKVLKRERLNQ